MLNRLDTVLRPTLCLKDNSSKLRRAQVVLFAHLTARGGSVRVMQQGGSMHDLQVGTFRQGKAFRHAVDAFDMREIMYGVCVLIPIFRLFQCQHA